jgi:hypothetical protein
MKKLTLTILSITAIAFLLAFISCQENGIEPEDEPDNNDDEIRSYTGTQSPGDVWSFDLNYTAMTWSGAWDHGTELDLTDDITLGGTFTELPSEYLKMVITSTSPADPLYPSDGSGFFYALEIPGMSLFANPKGSLSGGIINAVDRSTCSPDIYGDYKFVKIAPGTSAYSPLTEGAYGIINAEEAVGRIYMVRGSEISLDCPGGGPCTVNNDPFSIPGSGECIDGAADFYDAGTLVGKAQFTPSGVFMMDFGTGNGGIYGAKSDPTINLSDITGKELKGFVSDPVSGQHRATTITFDPATFVGGGTLYLDLETNTPDVARINDIYANSLMGGLLFAEIQNQNGLVAPLVGVVSINGSDIVIAGITHTDEAPFGAITAVMGYTP